LDGRNFTDRPVRTSLDNDGVMVTYLPARRLANYWFSAPLARFLWRETRRFDIIHVHSLYLFHTFAASRSSRHWGVPYVIRPHGTLNPYHRRRHRIRKGIYDLLIERRTMNAAAGIHCTSAAEQVHIEALGFKAPCFVVPHAIDAQFLKTVEDSARFSHLYPETENRKIIAFIGRLTPKKRLDLLIDSFAAICAEVRDSHLVIAGPDERGVASTLRNRIERLEIADRVTMTGLVDVQQRAILLRDASIFVLVSEDENFGVSVAEAMAAEVPVIISEAVAISPDVARAEAGVLVRRDRDNLAAALSDLLMDPARRKTLGENGLRLVRSKYSPDTVARDLERVYRLIRTGLQGNTAGVKTTSWV
jgi:glycosyltransferase involved in cell wall biosynthesis